MIVALGTNGGTLTTNIEVFSLFFWSNLKHNQSPCGFKNNHHHSNDFPFFPNGFFSKRFLCRLALFLMPFFKGNSKRARRE
jgi:hypothetical protein